MGENDSLFPLLIPHILLSNGSRNGLLIWWVQLLPPKRLLCEISLGEASCLNPCQFLADIIIFLVLRGSLIQRELRPWTKLFMDWRVDLFRLPGHC